MIFGNFRHVIFAIITNYQLTCFFKLWRWHSWTCLFFVHHYGYCSYNDLCLLIEIGHKPELSSWDWCWCTRTLCTYSSWRAATANWHGPTANSSWSWSWRVCCWWWRNDEATSRERWEGRRVEYRTKQEKGNWGSLWKHLDLILWTSNFLLLPLLLKTWAFSIRRCFGHEWNVKYRSYLYQKIGYYAHWCSI